ncbi:putative isochorismatase family protein [uncultured archaeon]|nr:putative isochorismatase family protein [uncultured archaeon]
MPLVSKDMFLKKYLLLNCGFMKKQEYSEKYVLELAKKSYEEGDVKFDIKAEKCALLIIDMQDEFVKPNWSPYWVPDATRRVPKIKRLIEHCRNRKIPVIFTVYSKTHQYLDRPKTLSLMPSRFPNLDIDQSSFFVTGNIWHELTPQNDEIIIHKSSYGAFFETPLETLLKNLGKDTVIISGTLTNYCCSTTARQAYERSFKVVFGSDVTAAHFPDLHEMELKVLRRGFAKVMSLNKLLKALS